MQWMLDQLIPVLPVAAHACPGNARKGDALYVSAVLPTAPSPSLQAALYQAAHSVFTYP